MKQSSPPYEPNPALAVLFRQLFAGIAVSPSWVQQIRERAANGPIVYVLPSLSFLDFLALDYVTKRYDLPRIRFTNDLRLSVLEPFGKGWLRAFSPRRVTPAVELAQVISAGGSAALFLKTPPTVRDIAAGRKLKRSVNADGDDLVRALLAAQRCHDQSICVAPLVFLWSKTPDTAGATLLDALLGSSQMPGRLRASVQVFLNYRSVVFRAGEPVDLAAYLQAEAPASADTLVRRLTYLLLRRLERQRQSVLGPVRKPPDRLREEVLRSPRLRAVVATLAGHEPSEERKLMIRSDDLLRRLQARPRKEVIDALGVFAELFINRIYAGVEVDEDGLQRIREAAALGSLVLLPSHKSHIDSLVVSYALYRAKLQVPLIAAGDNLAFFPLGVVARRAGAFFIRRSFKGDRLYPAVVNAYLRRLIRDGHTIEFFLEGGRSRTGKLRPPQLGLLNMVVEGALSTPDRELCIVPVSIGYDRIVEGGSHVHELSGGERKAETASGLLKMGRVLLGRYGRVTLQFGKIISLTEIKVELGDGSEGAQSTPNEAPASLSPAKRRAIVGRLAHRVMGEINRVTAVTSGPVVATILLSNARRGISEQELVRTSERLVRTLAGGGARISPSLRKNPAAAIREAARLFTSAGIIDVRQLGGGSSPRSSTETIYAVPDRNRLTLDISKNMIVHLFVPRALISAALSAYRSDLSVPLPLGVLEERVRHLSRLFKFEFIYRAEGSFKENFDSTLQQMQATGELSRNEPGISVGPGHDGWTGREWLRFYSSSLRPFLEAYLIAARSLHLLQSGPLSQKDLLKRAIALGDQMFLDELIQRPEAVNRFVLENAYLALASFGSISVVDSTISLAASTSMADALATYEQLVSPYIGELVAFDFEAHP